MMFQQRILAPALLGLSLALALPGAAQTAPAAKATGLGSAGKVIPVAQFYEGGQEAMYTFIDHEVKYPILAKHNRMQGQCIVSFTLGTDGVMHDLKLVKQIGGGTGEEALRVASLLKFKKPDYPMPTSLPIVFKLGVTGEGAK